MNIFKKFVISSSSLLLLAACGGGGGSSPFTIEALSASFTINEDTSLIDNVDATPSIPTSITFELQSGPSNGSIALNPDGRFNYTPNLDFSGSDSFQFRAFSSEKNTYSNVATVSLTINSVNDAPVVVVQDSLNEFSILFDNKPVFGFDTSDVDDDLSEVNVRVLVNGVEYPTTLYDATIPENPYPFGVEVDITNLKKAGLTTFEILVNDGETDGIGIIRTYVAREVVVADGFRSYVLKSTDDVVVRTEGNSTGRTNYLFIGDSINDNEGESSFNSHIDQFHYRLTESVRNLEEDSDVSDFVKDYFNIYVVEGADPDNQSLTGLYTGCLDWDTSIYCWDWNVLNQTVATALPGISVDTISILAGFYGRGVARGSVNCQPISSRSSEIVMHEAGHSHANLGDEYTTSDDRGYDMSVYADSSPNTTTVNDPYQVKWSHWIVDKTNVPGYTEGASQEGVGLFQGTYYSTEYSWRPKYRTIMVSGVLNYGEINAEAFVTETIAGTCLKQYGNTSSCTDVWNQIYFTDTSGNETSINNLQQNVSYQSIGYQIDKYFNESNIELNWYIDGILQEELTNETNPIFTRPEGGGVVHYSYRAMDTDGYITVDDNLLDPNDNYEGFYNSDYVWNPNIDWSGSYTTNPDPSTYSDYAIGYIDGTVSGTIGINWDKVQ